MALKELYRRVGDLVLDEKGLARRRLLIRHLVLPGNLLGAKRCWHSSLRKFLLIYLTLMDQLPTLRHAAVDQDAASRTGLTLLRPRRTPLP